VGGVRSSDQAVMRAAARRWPLRLRLIDWVARSAGRWDWFWSDGLHLRPEGARAFARMIRGALTEAAEPPPQQDPGGGVPAPLALSAGSARA
jgi:lysophospholipase L1-like esterase